MPLNDTQKYTIVSTAHSLLETLWQELNQFNVKERMRKETNPFADLEIFGGMIRMSYFVNICTEDKLIQTLSSNCSAIYPSMKPSETKFYKTTMDIRRLCNGDEQYLKNTLKLDVLANTLPTGEDIRALITPMLDEVSTALLNSIYKNDIESKINYVRDILNKDYFPELDNNSVSK